MVANDFAINPAAARMRWSRLRKNIALNSSFKNDPNLSTIFGQKKKRKVVDGPPAPPGKKGKLDVKMEGEDDDEVVFVGEDTWKVKAEMKAEDVGESSSYSIGSIGTDVMGDDYQTGPGGPGQGAHGMQGVDDALARVMDPMLFETSPGNCTAGSGVLGPRSLSLGPATVGEAPGTERQTFSMPPGPYAPVIAVGGKAPSPVGFASSSTTIETLATGEVEAIGFRTKLSGNDGHVSSSTTPLVDIVTETGAIDSVEEHKHAIFGKASTSDVIPETPVTQSEASCIKDDTIILLSTAAALTSPANDQVLDTTTAASPANDQVLDAIVANTAASPANDQVLDTIVVNTAASPANDQVLDTIVVNTAAKAPTADAIPETSVTQSEASCIKDDTIILLSTATALTSPANDQILDTIVVDTAAKAPIDCLDDCSQVSKSLIRGTSRKGSQKNENNYGSDSELTELSENEGNHGDTIVLKIPNDGKFKVAPSVEAIMSDIPVDEIPTRALRARREKENKAEIPGLGEDGEEELEEEDYEDEDSDGEWVDERK
jgi:hypothetical protein